MENLDLRLIQERLSVSDESALIGLYQTCYKKLFHFAKAIVRTNELAEEAVEDVFINLWCRRNSVSGINDLNVYLYTSVKNASLNILSKKARELVAAPFDFLNIELQDEFLSPDEMMITEEIMRKMQRAVEALPPRCKMIFKLIREDGLKYKDVADILNISVNTIDAQMAIAVKKLCLALNVEKPFRHSRNPAAQKNPEIF
ncbi:MAG TPA: RNA polymerase sigma-70 factor [Parafilimonas sp.]|nr:RNA polymerase sigma-70 factor [Parafilimonas sp.]